MKKYFVIALLASIFIIPSVSFAAISDSGLLPDSSLYFLKSWKESIQLFFTFNAENKAKQYLHLAEIRMAEYQKMLEKGKDDIAEKTLTKYQNQLNHALAKAEEIKQKGKDIKDLFSQIEQVASKHLEVLQQNLEKVPETAKKGIENAIENSQKEIEKFLEMKINKEEENKREKQEELKENNETSDWKTYRNEKYGFEVKYPGEWYIIDGDKNKIDMGYWNMFSIILSEKLIKLNNDKGILLQKDSVAISIYVESGGFTLGTRNWENFKLGDIEGSIAIESNCDKKKEVFCSAEVLFLDSTKTNYFYITTSKHPLLDELTNQILSTFKFIK